MSVLAQVCWHSEGKITSEVLGEGQTSEGNTSACAWLEEVSEAVLESAWGSYGFVHLAEDQGDL